MNLIISNIAWAPEHDEEMYLFLSQNGFDGLEVAPSRIFPDFPYDHAREMKAYASRLKDAYGLAIRSMQSIWFGRTENIFDGAEPAEGASFVHPKGNGLRDGGRV